MIKYRFILFWFSFSLCGCYGVNQKTSVIESLNTNCLDENTWGNIISEHTISNITDSIYLNAVESIQNRTFNTDLLFFNDDPVEIIAVSEDRYFIRYVFNPLLSDQVLDGFSSELSEFEKRRVRNRVQSLLIKYQCPKGKKESLDLMNE
jgi:hypothetical protein